MKRFWSEAVAAPAAGGIAILLDGRPVRTPRGAPLLLPTMALGEAVAAEWRAGEDRIDPGAMQLTGLANAALDIVAPDPAAFAGDLAAYAQSDLTCYRAEGPAALVARQVAAWEPPLKAVEARLGLVFRRTAGVMPVDQPPATLAESFRYLAQRPPLVLAALSPMVRIAGSLVLPIAVAEGLMPAAAAFAAASVDEAWAAEQWGADGEAQARLSARRGAFETGARFLALLGDRPFSA